LLIYFETPRFIKGLFNLSCYYNFSRGVFCIVMEKWRWPIAIN